MLKPRGTAAVPYRVWRLSFIKAGARRACTEGLNLMQKAEKISGGQIRDYRLWAHHLDAKRPMSALKAAAGACGVQNSPPGAWESAMFNRLEGCTLRALNDALYVDKTLLQAWSFRGAPAVFPTEDSDAFLASLSARPGEEPWIYTRGIGLALDYLGMSFDETLSAVRAAARYLNAHTVKSKEALDETLARIVAQDLPPQKRALWSAPSMYGRPDRQSVGGAAVSFLLRPCAFSGLVVFGERQGVSPTFTSFENWTGRPFKIRPDCVRTLVKKFLHCYGPARPSALSEWLGCSPAQAGRLWSAVQEEIQPVSVDEKIFYMLSEDMDRLRAGAGDQRAQAPVLLGAHDPYLDARDRRILLGDAGLHKLVWKTVANPGVVLLEGRVAGVWKSASSGAWMKFSVTLFETLNGAQRRALGEGAEAYARFRGAGVKSLDMEG